MRHIWRASHKKFFRLKHLLIQYFPVALSLMFLLVYAESNFVSVLNLWLQLLSDQKFFSTENNLS